LSAVRARPRCFRRRTRDFALHHWGAGAGRRMGAHGSVAIPHFAWTCFTSAVTKSLGFLEICPSIKSGPGEYGHPERSTYSANRTFDGAPTGRLPPGGILSHHRTGPGRVLGRSRHTPPTLGTNVFRMNGAALGPHFALLEEEALGGAARNLAGSVQARARRRLSRHVEKAWRANGAEGRLLGVGVALMRRQWKNLEVHHRSNR